MGLIEKIIVWVLSKLFGGGKAAEQSEQLGELKNDQKSKDAVLRAVAQGNQAAKDVVLMSDADVANELSRDWRRPE